MNWDVIVSIIWDWRFVLIIVLGIVIYAILDWKNFKIKLNALMLVAKSLAKDKILNSGQEQEDFVVEKLYAIMPAKLKVFISQELLRKIVKKAYATAKDLLDDGKLNGSIQ
jgi:hypothetical protein